MTERSAVIFIPDDTAKTGLSAPLFLCRAAGSPLLLWLTCELARHGIRRAFLICPAGVLPQALSCFPEEIRVTVSGAEEVPDALHVFLSTADESETDVTVVTAPVALLPGETAAGNAPTGVCLAPRLSLMSYLDTGLPLSAFFRESGVRCTASDGFFRIDSPEQLQRTGPLLSRNAARRLMREGVEIWDETQCWLSPQARAGAGTVLLPGTVLQGNTVIGKNCVIGPDTRLIDCTVGDGAVAESTRAEKCEIGENACAGPFAHLRPGTVLKAGAKAGAFTELKNTVLGESSAVPHLSYLGDCEVGDGANIGCGTVTANFDRAEKHRTQIGSRAFVGCGTTLVAPVEIGSGAYIGAGSVITENVPPEALGIARSRQTVRRDWAVKNKKAEDTE